MRYASIDIGTNTLRLLIAELDGESLRPLFYKRKITRLGGGYDEEAGISDEAAERTFAALKEFRRHIDDSGVTTVLAFATSVVRRASNREWFRGEVMKRAGIEITVIQGGEEARLSLLGVLSVIDERQGKKFVMDVGGGSTEFIATIGPEMSGGWSMEMGVVHLTEKYLLSDPPSSSELKAMEDEINGVLEDLRSRMLGDGVDPLDFSGKRGASFVGTAGTITTLAAIDQDLDVYDRTKINNYTLSKERIEEIYGRLCSMTLGDRQTVLSLEKGREDLIVPGSAITLLAMEGFGFSEAKVSDAGLLEGIILDRAMPGIALKY
jgi:exopolyphosphatase/guanosine-5'-triphosphate,3'-diphosphate pyrophosphatase